MGAGGCGFYFAAAGGCLLASPERSRARPRAAAPNHGNRAGYEVGRDGRAQAARTRSEADDDELRAARGVPAAIALQHSKAFGARGGAFSLDEAELHFAGFADHGLVPR